MAVFLALINRADPAAFDRRPIWLGYQIMVIGRGKRVPRRPQRGRGPPTSRIRALRTYLDIGYFIYM